MEAATDIPNPGIGIANPLNPRGNKNPRNRQKNNSPRSGNVPSGIEDQGSSRGFSKHSRQPIAQPSEPGPSTSASTAPDEVQSVRQRKPGRRYGAKPPDRLGNDANTLIDDSKNGGGSESKTTHPEGGKPRRGGRFNAGLTEPKPSSDSAPATKPSVKYRSRKTHPAEAVADDLTSIFIHALRTPPYPDCPICFSAIHPAQPTWSCSPSIPIVRADNTSANDQQYCWTTFHVKCIGSWASKSVKDVTDAWRARGEEGRKGDWRCPGCQAKRESVPSGYWYAHFRHVQREKHSLSYYLLGAFATRRRNRNLHALQLHIHVRIPVHACVKAVVDIHVL